MKKDSSLANSLAVLAGAACALIGVGYTAETPDTSAAGTGLVGFLIGYGCGYLAGAVLSIILQIFIALVCIGIVLLRISNLASCVAAY